MISPQIIEELKYRNDIEDVISGYVTLKRAGSNLVGLCPFHSERSPSFTVFTGTRSFYCFGCGAGGDVISFVMRAENLDYMDALRYLAKRAGIELPDDGTGQTGGVNRERILAMNREAAKFFSRSSEKVRRLRSISQSAGFRRHLCGISESDMLPTTGRRLQSICPRSGSRKRR